MFLSKIVGLRESERKLRVQIEEQEMKSVHQKNMMRELESALEHIKLQCDRQLTHQRQEHEKKIQFILNNFKGIFFWVGIIHQVFSLVINREVLYSSCNNE